MKSPFPGMDPYIEASRLWGDFHFHLVVRISEWLNSVLPEEYVSRIDRREYTDVSYTPFEDAPLTPNHVVSTPTDPDAPVSMRAFFAESYREPFLQIFSLADGERHPITRVEVLSPANKRMNSEGWDQFLSMRRRTMLAMGNYVELDLLRGGTKMPMVDPWPRSPYTLLVARQLMSPLCRVWPAYSINRLPIIPIPLESHPPLQLDIQPIMDESYRIGRYGMDIDYNKPLHPPLLPEEKTWLAEQLKARAKA